jgi:hypothetical protein
MLEFLYGTNNTPLMVPFTYDIISKETALPLEEIVEVSSTNQVN